MFKGKRGIIWDALLPWIIGIGVLFFGIVLYALLTGKTEEALEFLENLFRFGR